MNHCLTPKKSAGAVLGIATVASILASVPAQAAGPNFCAYDPVSKIATAHLIAGGGNVMEIEFDGDKLAFFDQFGAGVCKNPVTGELAIRSNTRSILFEGNQGITEDFIVSARGGNFRGGASGGTDPTQIETNVFSTSEDSVDAVGTDSADFIQITGGAGTGKQGGVLLDATNNSNPTVKLVGEPALVRVNGLSGGDIISGGQFFSTPTSMHLSLSGGLGSDNIVGGLRAGDRLQGNDGDDHLTSTDGQPGDIVTGGLGVDTAAIDPTDQATGVEKFEITKVGKLKLSPRAVSLGKHGSGTLRMSWSHPTSWKKLRSITLSAYADAKRVGSIVIHPKTGKVTDHGALRLTKPAKVTHHGPTVSAKLALTVAPSTVGNGLRVQVKAVSTSGKRQVQTAAGTLSIKSAT